MQFSQIPNAAISKEADRPLMQKEVYAVSNSLQQYLQQFEKDVPLPISYKELLHYEYSNAIKDEYGKHTHWEKVVYNEKLLIEIKEKLLALYTLLKNEPNIEIESIDFCEFANSMPFRINIFNTRNNTKNFFYIKSADASRIYGLELEQLLTDNHINFLYHQNTLVEEHIDGIPGDVFQETADRLAIEQKELLAAAFIRFNENCFARLLGDMRSYNFVVLKNNNVENPFIVKAIDFDQQCYEGKLNLYFPQFYKENYGYVQMITKLFSNDAIENIRITERKNLAGMIAKNQPQLQALLNVMDKEEISENYKVLSLRKELDEYHHTNVFTRHTTMGSLVKEQLYLIAGAYLPAHNQAAATI